MTMPEVHDGVRHETESSDDKSAFLASLMDAQTGHEALFQHLFDNLGELPGSVFDQLQMDLHRTAPEDLPGMLSPHGAEAAAMEASPPLPPPEISEEDAAAIQTLLLSLCPPAADNGCDAANDEDEFDAVFDEAVLGQQTVPRASRTLASSPSHSVQAISRVDEDTVQDGSDGFIERVVRDDSAAQSASCAPRSCSSNGGANGSVDDSSSSDSDADDESGCDSETYESRNGVGIVAGEVAEVAEVADSLAAAVFEDGDRPLAEPADLPFTVLSDVTAEESSAPQLARRSLAQFISGGVSAQQNFEEFSAGMSLDGFAFATPASNRRIDARRLADLEQEVDALRAQMMMM
eukprot:NODE_2127_length_1286_cov_52.930477_g1935_i0.p1 GENE.NODE_2127_length_1286_cov_52.930477_g1935_i0~~NODE_2127_length_1286_cov_52.930477_g1935_i0.p1  ORF type:complete len:349 (+),score=84.62 NODE_2127_length_1286_cov_52.930477_g1935_i0:156-1202(+)